MKRSILIFCLLTISCIVLAEGGKRIRPMGAIIDSEQHETLFVNKPIFGIQCNYYPDNDIKGISFSYETMQLSFHERIYQRQGTNYSFIINKYRTELTKEQADAIFSLITAVICSASSKEDFSDVTDGISYILNISHHYGTFKPLHISSNCDKLSNIIYTLMICAKEQDSTIIDEKMEEIKALTHEFIKLYEKNPQEKQEIFDLHKKYRVKGSAMNLVF